MSSKSDNDNRSNQLNPNNGEYHSSRGSSPDTDDDDGFDYKQWQYAASAAHEVRVSRSLNYGFGAVTLSGQAAYVTANFHTTASVLAMDSHRNCQNRFELFLEDFSNLARGHLQGLLGNDQLALFAVFDSSISRLPWHAQLVPDDMKTTGDGINLSRCEFVAPQLMALMRKSAETPIPRNSHSGLPTSLPKLTSHKDAEFGLDEFLNALRKALCVDAVSIGEFEVSHIGRISLAEQSAIHRRLAKLRLQKFARDNLS